MWNSLLSISDSLGIARGVLRKEIASTGGLRVVRVCPGDIATVRKFVQVVPLSREIAEVNLAR